MDKNNIIVVDNATVRFNMASEKVDNLKEYFIKLTKRQLYFEEFLALKDINLNIKRGESWGLIGRNGAGKSTLLKLICGILSPYKGNVTVNGSIAPLIELGAGLDSRLTAGENILLNGALLGHSKKYMQDHFDEIVEFAELGNFLDMPIKNYSSGMRARLGFAIATTVSPDILIVDEVLSVGDAAFRQKCEQRMNKMLSSGTTLLFVSHNEREVERLCQNAVWLENGEIARMGNSEEVCGAYARKINPRLSPAPHKPVPPIKLPHLTVIGAGYVGLVTSAAFASKGYKVTCFDTDTEKINALLEDRCPLFEPDLANLIKKHKKNLFFTSNIQDAYRNAEAILIAVGTPELSDGSVDLQYVYQAAEGVAQNISRKCMVIIKSTVPVGTAENIRRLFKKNVASGVDIHVVSNPEFLSQGTAVHDMLSPSRIIVGTENAEDARFMENLYKPFDASIVSVSCSSAEMIKYASNDFLALKISYINEIANLCERTGADITEVVRGMEKDPRIGSGFLKAGIGYGGSCLPKDTKALCWLANKKGYPFRTLRAAIAVNELQQQRLIEKAHTFYKSLEGIKIACLGVTFKPGTDDIRNSPAVRNAQLLLEEHAELHIWDPKGLKNFSGIFQDHIKYCSTIRDALENADLCMIFTDWDEIKQINPMIFEEAMRKPIILDGRNCFDSRYFENTNVIYKPIGANSQERI